MPSGAAARRLKVRRRFDFANPSATMSGTRGHKALAGKGRALDMKIIVIAKAQNRRLPRKHFLEVAGRPLIHWAVLDAVAVPQAPIVIAADSEELNDFAVGADLIRGTGQCLAF